MMARVGWGSKGMVVPMASFLGKPKQANGPGGAGVPVLMRNDSVFAGRSMSSHSERSAPRWTRAALGPARPEH